jgi:tripartite-type tricarboxylate transporter receptor subunit TctC
MRAWLKGWGGALAAVGWVLSGHSHAQEFPLAGQSISIVLPYTPTAGGAIVLARQLAEYLRPLAGVPVVVEYKPGALTNIGAAYVAKSKPNGHTLLLTSGSSTFAFNTHLFKTLPFDPHKGFAGITTLSAVPSVLLVNRALNVTSVEELTRVLKTKKDKGSYGSATPFNTVLSELYKTRAGLDTVRIAYKGFEQTWPELMNGGLDFAFTDPGNATMVLRQPWSRALAVTSARRNAQFPDLPTMMEAGIAQFEAESWLGVYAPAGTPRPVRETLSGWINRIMASDEIKKVMDTMRYSPFPGSPDSLDKLHAAEIEKWGRLIRAANLEHSAE